MKNILKHLSYIGLVVCAVVLSACTHNPFTSKRRVSSSAVTETVHAKKPAQVKKGDIPVKPSKTFGERSPHDVKRKKAGRRGEDLSKSVPPSDAKSKLAIAEKKRKEEIKKKAEAVKAVPKPKAKPAVKKAKAEVKKTKTEVAKAKPETKEVKQISKKVETVKKEKTTVATPVVPDVTKETEAKKKELARLQEELARQQEELTKVQDKLASEGDKLQEATLEKREQEKTAFAEKVQKETELKSVFGNNVSAKERKISTYADTVEDWTAYEGATLKGLLQEWGDVAGWRVVWNIDRDYPLEAGAVFRGRFVDVTSALLRSFARAVPAPLGTFYRGNKVLVISTREDENAD